MRRSGTLQTTERTTTCRRPKSNQKRPRGRKNKLGPAGDEAVKFDHVDGLLDGLLLGEDLLDVCRARCGRDAEPPAIEPVEVGEVDQVSVEDVDDRREDDAEEKVKEEADRAGCHTAQWRRAAVLVMSINRDGDFASAPADDLRLRSASICILDLRRGLLPVCCRSVEFQRSVSSSFQLHYPSMGSRWRGPRKTHPSAKRLMPSSYWRLRSCAGLCLGFGEAPCRRPRRRSGSSAHDARRGAPPQTRQKAAKSCVVNSGPTIRRLCKYRKP